MIWNRVCDNLPDRDTKYAGPFGVCVMGYDKTEERLSGYYEPVDVMFDFESQEFKMLCTGGDWSPAFWVSHWAEKPCGPTDDYEVMEEVS